MEGIALLEEKRIAWMRVIRQSARFSIVIELALLLLGAFIYAPSLAGKPLVIAQDAPLVIFLSILLAGIGQWLLAYSVGMGAIVRVWSGAMLMFCGKLAIMINAGWWPFVIGFPWLALFFAFLLLGVRTRRLFLAPLCALALAVPFVLGTGEYYAFLVFGGAIAGLVLLWNLDARTWRVSLNWFNLQFLLLAVLTAAALIAVRTVALRNWFLPLTWPVQEVPATGCVQELNWTWLNFFIKESVYYQGETAGKVGAPVFFYSYIGLTPFVSLVLLVPALQKGRRREIILFSLLFLASLVIVNGRAPNLGFLGASCPLYAFALETVALITLAGFGIQHLFDTIKGWNYDLSLDISRYTDQAAQERGTVLPLRWLVGAIIVVLLLLSLKDVYDANHGRVMPGAPQEQEQQESMLHFN